MTTAARRHWIGRPARRLAAALLPALGAVALVSSPAAAAGHTIVGYLSLQEHRGYATSPCRGSGGYADIAQGTPVVVRDAQGAVIGQASFGPGRTAGRGDVSRFGLRSACVFRFVVRSVPDASAYTFQVSTRGGLTYSYAELSRSKWRIGAVLGD
jgi:hypothetical protein